MNECYYSAVESKKLQENLTTEKMKPTTVSRRLRTGDRLSEIKQRLKSSVLSRRLKAIVRFEHSIQQSTACSIRAVTLVRLHCFDLLSVP